MNKLFLAVAALGVVFFTSCGDEEPPQKEDPKEETPEFPTSLRGTCWKGVWDYGDGLVIFDEMVFTSTTATFNAVQKDGGYSDTFSGSYIYDREQGKFVMPNDSAQIFPIDNGMYIPDLIGTIKDGVMTFDVWESFDVYRTVTLKKQ